MCNPSGSLLDSTRSTVSVFVPSGDWIVPAVLPYLAYSGSFPQPTLPSSPQHAVTTTIVLRKTSFILLDIENFIELDPFPMGKPPGRLLARSSLPSGSPTISVGNYLRT